MTCVTNKGHRHQIGIKNGAAFPVDYRMAPVSVNHVWTPTFAEDTGARGIGFKASEGVVYNTGKGSGPITIEPRPEDLRIILPLLLLGTFSTNVIEPENLCTFFQFEHDAWAQRHRFGDCITNTWSLASSQRAPVLRLDWSFESKTFTQTSTAFPTLQLSYQQPFVHKQSVVTIDGTAYKVDDLNISGNNSLETDLLYNSATRDDIPPGIQMFTLTHSSPFDDADGIALLNLGASSVEASVVYTSGPYSLTIEFPALQSPVKSPVMSGNQIVRHNGIQWEARSIVDSVDDTIVHKPIKITLDDTE